MSYIDLNLRQLQTFVTVARLGSLTRAANLLHLSQPALTKQIRQLEETLGVRLLDRNTRGVKPTNIGKELAPSVERLLSEIDSVMISTKELAARSRGVVRVAALPTIAATILPAAIAKLKEQHPGISVRLNDKLAQLIVKLVKDEKVDFGIGSLAGADAEVKFTLLLRDRMNVIFPSGSALERTKVIELKDIVGLPLVLMDPESSVRKLVDRAFESIGHLAVPAYEATYMSTAVSLVKAGLGITILPSSALTMGELTGLRSRPIKHAALTRDLGIIQKSGRSLSPAAESFLDSVKAVCKEMSK